VCQVDHAPGEPTVQSTLSDNPPAIFRAAPDP
jgi:hypothetical protein